MKSLIKKNKRSERSAMKDPYLTIAEIVKLMKVDYQVVRALIVGGHLRAVKFGRQWRIKQSDLDHFIQSRTTSLIHH